ncbi:hypothetical protein [Nannocystis pusilla]|uniref:Lipoprotein n=1 Tax=Nannocystis pusilla TaxID=889268 RepID=A0ABS7U0T5_9BACT|nr:hypothetical protein [Nannocystis pusilla]MBZ5714134.1 hypothetical protein [Nannocystis pusilla]
MFEGTDGPGQRYGCAGAVQGELRFVVCDFNDEDEIDCEPSVESNQVILIDSEETEGADGIIPFNSDDPTEGPRVETCCEVGIEADPEGEEKGDAACLVDCAHAACSDALARFEALILDPPDDKCSEGTPPPSQIEINVCEDNIAQSVKYWRDKLLENFDLCVQIVADSGSGVTLNLGSAGCVQDLGVLKGGCFADAVLDLKCTSAEIDFETNTDNCTEAKNQPPTKERQSCVVEDSEIEITDGAAFVAPQASGTITTTDYACFDPLCVFMIDTLSLQVEDVVYGSSDLEDIEINLITPAAGMSDGSSVEFPPGSIWVRVTGNMVDVTGSVPFEVTAGNSITAFGRRDPDLIVVDDVVFETDTYVFTASVAESECEPL